MSFLGAILIPLFGVFYALSNPGATDPTWARGMIAVLFGGLLAISYASRWVRRNYVGLMRGILYLMMGWISVVAWLNGFVVHYAVGVLVVYAVLIVVVGVGSRTMAPILRFAGIGLFLAAGAIAAVPTPQSSPVVLLGSMATLALVESIAIRAHFTARRRLQDREARLRGIANSIPGVIFRLHAYSEGTYGLRFVNKHTEAVLETDSEPEHIFEQFVERIHASSRQDFLEMLEAAVDAERSWRFEVPFEKQSGEQVWLLGAATPERREKEMVFNGLLLDITDRKNAERALQDRQQKMESLYTAVSLLLTPTTPDAVAGRTHGVLQDVFDYPVGFVVLLKDGTVVSKGEAVGDGPRSEGRAVPERAKRIAARACELGETVVIEDVSVSSEMKTLNDVYTVAAVPMGKHGSIVVGEGEREEFDPFDLRLIEVLATHVTVVLDRLGVK